MRRSGRVESEKSGCSIEAMSSLGKRIEDIADEEIAAVAVRAPTQPCAPAPCQILPFRYNHAPALPVLPSTTPRRLAAELRGFSDHLMNLEEPPVRGVENRKRGSTGVQSRLFEGSRVAGSWEQESRDARLSFFYIYYQYLTKGAHKRNYSNNIILT
jgi:hypothetical protein